MEILEKKTELSASFRRAVDEIPTLSREDHEFRPSWFSQPRSGRGLCKVSRTILWYRLKIMFIS